MSISLSTRALRVCVLNMRLKCFAVFTILSLLFGFVSACQPVSSMTENEGHATFTTIGSTSRNGDTGVMDNAAGWVHAQTSNRGPQVVIVILVEFPDLRHSSPKESIRNSILRTVSQYYSEVSYNATWVVGEVTDWIMMPSLFRSYGNMGHAASWDQREKLVRDVVSVADKGVDFRKYMQVVIVVPVGASLVSYSLTQRLIPTDDGTFLTQVTVQSEDRAASVFAHELGHTLGLRDMYDHDLAAKLGSSDDGAIYMGVWDLMSMALSDWRHFSSYNKITLGWISSDRVRTVSVNKTGTAIVDPIELPSNNIQTIKVQLGGPRYYLVEVRQKIGFDKTLPDEGVLVTLIDDSVKGDGFARVVDAKPTTNTLNDATFDIREGKTSIYVDTKLDLAIVLLEKVGLSYRIHMTAQRNQETALGTWKTILESNRTIQAAQNAGRVVGLEDAKAALKQAISNFDEGSYDRAMNLARQASALAEKATKPTTTTGTSTVQQTINTRASSATQSLITESIAAPSLDQNTIMIVSILVVLALILTYLALTRRRRHSDPMIGR